MRFIALLGIMVLTACAAAPRPEQTRGATSADIAFKLPAMRQFKGGAMPGPIGPNAGIARDFLELAFEMETGRSLDRLTRFEGPITLRLTGPVPPTASADAAHLVARLRREAGIDITQVSGSARASITVQFLPRAKMQALVPHAACFVVPRVGSWEEYRRTRNGAATDWTTLDIREAATIFIPSDTAPQEVRDCLHEEVAQALGPLNDLYRLPNSVFNDDNFHTILTGFDMLILRAYYSDALRNGMTRGEVAAVLPGLLARLNPAGGAGGIAGPDPTPRAFITSMETALGPRAAPAKRRGAAYQATSIVAAEGWQDGRAAFAYFALARLSVSMDVNKSLEAFAIARRIYRTTPAMAVQEAHVDMQMAAYALSAGRADDALTLVDRAMPAITQSENAAMLASLLMVRAEALALKGEATAADGARTEALGWARYGFGSDAEVRKRMSEIARLAQRTRTQTP